jgi:ligand-binding SRPBCC domain-containing protein
VKVYKLVNKQFIPIDLRTAWDFFSSPNNLALITPSKINFKILSISGGNKMYAGQVIIYRVNVLPLVRMRWVTEIGQVQEPEYFVDNQRAGPFSMWHHKHHFREVEGGIEMVDELHYGLPLGWLGRLAHIIFVRREVNHIFEHRTRVLESHFSKVTRDGSQK